MRDRSLATEQVTHGWWAGSRRLSLLVVVVTLVAFAPAAAQVADPAPLLGTRPMEGAVLTSEEVPPTARAVFAEPVAPGDPAVEVRDAEGRRVDRGDDGAGPSPAVVEVSLPQDLPAGDYVARWTVRDRDGDTDELSGSWGFEVVAADGGLLGGRSGAPDLAIAVVAAVAVSGALVAVRRRRGRMG